MGAIKNHLIDMLKLLENKNYLELLQDCKRWEDPAEQLWAIVSYQAFTDYPSLGWMNSNQSLECPNHEGSFDCSPFCELCEGKQEYERQGN